MRLRLHSEQRDALYSEFFARAASVIRNEVVGRIIFNLDDAQSRHLYFRSVIVLLCSTANARGPKCRVADDALLTNPHIRFLLLCGRDTQQLVGHLPGQSIASLFRNGLDERGRIIGAKGKRPVLKNVSREEVQAFLQQVEFVPMIGEERAEAVTRQIGMCAKRNPGPFPHPVKDLPIERIEVQEPQHLTLDKAGYFVIYPDARAGRLVVEHYTNPGVLDCVLEGGSPGAIYTAAIERQFLTRLDHAAYLGKELARAERSLLEGRPFFQDAAPGEVAGAAPQTTCESDSLCGCSPPSHPKGGC